MTGSPRRCPRQMSSNGEPAGEPLLVPGGMVDKGAGMWAAIATLGALLRRGRTGQGAVVETSLLEASLFWRDGGFAKYQATGRVAPARRQRRRDHRALRRVPHRHRPDDDRLRRRRAVRRPRPPARPAEWIEDPRFAEQPRARSPTATC